MIDKASDLQKYRDELKRRAELYKHIHGDKDPFGMYALLTHVLNDHVDALDTVLKKGG